MPQADICSEVMKRHLETHLGRKVVVGSISAKSWGAPNELAYIQRFGLFDADAVVLVLSSHDYADVPTFVKVVGVDPEYPDHTPFFAAFEIFTRYLPRYVRGPWGRRTNPDKNQNPSSSDIS